MSLLYFTRACGPAGTEDSRQPNGLFQQLLHALVAVADGEHHRHVQQVGERALVDLHAAVRAMSAMLRAKITLQSSSRDLGGEVEAALQVRGVDNVDDDIRPLVQEIVAGHHFFDGERGQAVGPGQVDDGDIVARPADMALLLFNRDPRQLPPSGGYRSGC